MKHLLILPVLLFLSLLGINKFSISNPPLWLISILTKNVEGVGKSVYSIGFSKELMEMYEVDEYQLGNWYVRIFSEIV
jgi:hypothetical protein